MRGNIGARGRRLRLALGVGSLSAAALLASFLFALDADPWWRLTVFVPLHLGILGVAQARTGVCAAYAALGAWELDCKGPQQIPDMSLEIRFKQQAKKMLLVTSLASALLTFLLLLF
jgi:hypothetical protein